jgi:hypothetical protein
MPKLRVKSPKVPNINLDVPRKRRSVASKATHALLSPVGGAIVGTAATVAVAAWQEFEHRRIDFADLTEVPVRVERLSELKHDAEALALIEAGLKKEWGHFGLLGFESIHDMLAQAGGSIFIALLQEGDKFLPKAALQTTVGDFGGDPEALRHAFRSFDELTSAGAMHGALRKGGDTALLLQITVFDQENRGIGIGSLLRDAGLNLLDESVKYALTMTPVDVAPGKPALDISDTATYTPAMRFHGKGGALPTIGLPAYKTPPEGESSGGHGHDIVVMRYSRDDDGAWPVEAPQMRIHRVGPLQARWIGTRKGIGRLRRRIRGKLHLRRRKASEIVVEDGLTQE